MQCASIYSVPLLFRTNFELKLLALFSDLGLVARSKPELHHLGYLLPVIADSWHDDRLSTMRVDALLVKVHTSLHDTSLHALGYLAD
jgi:hypothetical protein